MATNAGQEQFKFPDENAATQQEEKLDISVEGEGDVDVAVIDDTPPEDRDRPPLKKEVADPTEEELAAYSENTKKRINELTRARHDERRRADQLAREKEELERVTRKLVEDHQRLKSYTAKGEEAYATTLKSAAEARLEMAKKQFKEAHESFDSDALMAAQEELMSARLELEKATSFRPTALQTEEKPVYNEPTEAAVPRPDERTLRWQQRNQWFGADDEMTAVALAQHKKLVTAGVDPRSEEYFEQIDARMHTLFPDFFGEREAPSEPTTRRPASVVAPATRSSGTRKVVLTKTQVQIAKRLGVPLELYAKQLTQTGGSE